MDLVRLPRLRPPCSLGERNAARLIAHRLAALQLGPHLEPFRASTGPVWAPLLRALLRLVAAVSLPLDYPVAALVIAGVTVVTGIPPVSRLVRFVPGFGGTAENVVTRIPGSGGNAPPLVVVAHLDTHASGGTPLTRPHALGAGISGLLVFGAAAARVAGGGEGWDRLAILVAIEALVTLAWLAGRELSPHRAGDDNDSGLLALLRTAELAADEPPVRDVWLVGTAAATSDGLGMRAFLRAHTETARMAWVVELDALGDGEIVVSRVRRRFPQASTPSALLRAIAGAAIDTGDPIDVRHVRRLHSDARAAFLKGCPAAAITGGVRLPLGVESAPDPANAERAARIIDHLARTTL